MPRCRALLLVVCSLAVPLLASAQGPAEPDAPSYVRTTTAPPSPARIVPVVQPVLAPAPAPRPKVLDKKYWFLTSLAVGLTVADVELTQRCLHHGTCRELNPTLPHSHMGMYLANVPVTGALFYWSYRRKARGQRLWWLPTLIDAGAHAVGAADNLRFK